MDGSICARRMTIRLRDVAGLQPGGASRHEPLRQPQEGQRPTTERASLISSSRCNGSVGDVSKSKWV